MKTQTPEQKNQTLFSHHIFLFPFVWIQEKKVENSKLSPLDKFVHDILNGEESKWESTAFEIDRVLNYNEYNYFYEYVREVLYDLEKVEKVKENQKTGKITKSKLWSTRNENRGIIKHLRFDPKQEKEWKYYIKVDHDGKAETPYYDYCLNVDSIFLHLYQTGVGVISIHLNNYDENQSSPEDILRINQYGRRVYPPYFELDPALVGTQEAFLNKDFTKPGLQLSAGLAIAKHDKDERERNDRLDQSFELYRKSPGDFEKEEPLFLRNPFHLPPFISQPFLGKVISTIEGKALYYISPALDDRMFVICWYGNDEISERLKPYEIDHNPQQPGNGEGKKTVVYPHKTDSWWYRYTFIDGGDEPSCQNDELLESLLTKATNPRWAKRGQFFGVTSFSFVLLSPSLSTLRKQEVAFIVPHLQTMYYKMVELVLVQRASVQRFSDEVADISKLPDKRPLNELTGKVGNLYKQYIRFVNKIFFREVTAQTQGKELYDMLLEQSNIEKYVKDLDSEINELHNYVLQMAELDRIEQDRLSSEREKERNQSLVLITQISAAFLGPSILIGYYGVSIFPNLDGRYAVGGMALLLVFIVLLSYFSTKSIHKESGKLNEKAIWMISLCLLIAMIAPLFFFAFEKPEDEQPKRNSGDQKKELELTTKMQKLQKQLDSLKAVIPSNPKKGPLQK